jgi:3-deoxy-D-manno-octulosonate 8-phosphate phosphatase (KDO 8-P phosphatase)
MANKRLKTMKMSRHVINKIKRVKVLALDVDGVLTNGKINIDAKGKEIKVFDVKDGFGIALLRKAGYKTAIITARSSEAVTARAKDLKIHKVFQNAYPKAKAFQDLLKFFDVEAQQVCYVGDDFPDLMVMQSAGLSVAVGNAVDEVKKEADYVTQKQGGAGAVREVVELILKKQGKWKTMVTRFTKVGD